MRRIVPCFLLLCSAASALRAQETPKPFALSGITLVDVRTGELRTGTTVLVEGRRIAAVGKSGEIRLPGGTRVIDATGNS
jgi:imidazolonepropionase-like amidohydrolase